jgi:GntR family transcriptional regulator / MocR family aminotransferase
MSKTNIGLHIQLTGVKDLTVQIYREIRQAILDGRLAAKSALPPSRQLAESLGVSRNTVNEAYARLMGEGLVLAHVGMGTVVCEGFARTTTASPVRLPVWPLPVKPYWHALAQRGSLLKQAPQRYDFRLGEPDVSQFPFDVWRRLNVLALHDLAKSSSGYGPAQGLTSLREAIAQWIGITRAVKCSASNIIVTSGAQQAFDLIARVLIEPGHVVAVENPGYVAAVDCFAGHGAKLLPVAVDAQGLCVRQLPQEVHCVYVTPSHQQPLGMAMTTERRVELLAWARSSGAFIVEDDYDSEFRYEGRALESLQHMDEDSRVLYVGTFSKSMFPAVRLGFVVVPDAAVNAFVEARAACDQSSNEVQQATLARFIAEGHLARHVFKMRRVYDERRQLIMDLLDKNFSEWLIPIPSVAGLHVAAWLKGAMNGKTLERAAASDGVGICDLLRFSREATIPEGLVFGFGAIQKEDISQGLAELLKTFQRLRPDSGAQA